MAQPRTCASRPSGPCCPSPIRIWALLEGGCSSSRRRRACGTGGGVLCSSASDPRSTTTTWRSGWGRGCSSYLDASLELLRPAEAAAQRPGEDLGVAQSPWSPYPIIGRNPLGVSCLASALYTLMIHLSDNPLVDRPLHSSTVLVVTASQPNATLSYIENTQKHNTYPLHWLTRSSWWCARSSPSQRLAAAGADGRRSHGDEEESDSESDPSSSAAGATSRSCCCSSAEMGGQRV